MSPLGSLATLDSADADPESKPARSRLHATARRDRLTIPSPSGANPHLRARAHASPAAAGLRDSTPPPKSGGTAETREAGAALPADEAHFDLVQSRGLLRAQVGVAVRSVGPHHGDRARDLFISSSAPQERAEIMPLCREEARVERAVRRQSRAGAVRAERLRHR